MQLETPFADGTLPPRPVPHASGSLVNQLFRRHRLSDTDRTALSALPLTISVHGAQQYLTREGDRPERCAFLVAGYACRHKVARGGGRQILSFHLPGDLLGALWLDLDYADHNVQTISSATVAWASTADLRRLIEERASIRQAVGRDTLIESSIAREWMLNVGRRNALTRVAHLLCELAVRRDAAGLGPSARFDLPMSQEDIADATGLTPVHVNRMLRTLDNLGVISRDRRDIRIVDWDKLAKAGDFNPAYLHPTA